MELELYVNKPTEDYNHVMIAYINITRKNKRNGQSPFCRVSMMQNGKFLIGWQVDAQTKTRMEMDEHKWAIVNESIDNAEKALQTWLDTRAKNLFDKAYEQYKLMWMHDHDFTLSDIIHTLHEELQDKNGPDDVLTAFAQLEQEGWLVHNHKTTYTILCPKH